jgi:hypothetical protein
MVFEEFGTAFSQNSKVGIGLLSFIPFVSQTIKSSVNFAQK